MLKFTGSFWLDVLFMAVGSCIIDFFCAAIKGNKELLDSPIFVKIILLAGHFLIWAIIFTVIDFLFP